MYKLLMSNFLRNSHTEKFRKPLQSVNFGQSYWKNKRGGRFLCTHYTVYINRAYIVISRPVQAYG